MYPVLYGVHSTCIARGVGYKLYIFRVVTYVRRQFDCIVCTTVHACTVGLKCTYSFNVISLINAIDRCLEALMNSILLYHKPIVFIYIAKPVRLFFPCSIPIEGNMDRSNRLFRTPCSTYFCLYLQYYSRLIVNIQRKCAVVGHGRLGIFAWVHAWKLFGSILQ